MSIFSEMGLGITSEQTLKNYISKQLKANQLKIRGFTDVLFFSIPPQTLSVDTMSNGDIKKMKTPACFYSGDTCNLIVGINK
jgi:hypothetical protein